MTSPSESGLPTRRPETVLVVPPPGKRGVPSATEVLAHQLARDGERFSYRLIGHERGPFHERLYGAVAPWNRVKLLGRLARPDRSALHHLLFTPSRRAVQGLRFARLLSRKRSVHTIPSVPDSREDLRDLVWAEHTVVVTEATALTLQSAGLPRPRVIRPGVELPDQLPDRAASRRELTPHTLPERWLESPLWLYPGDLAFSDGASTFIDAAALVAEQFPEARFLLACRTKTPEAVQRRASLRRDLDRRGLGDRVLFLGRVPQMDRLLGAVDGLVLSVDTLHAKLDTPLVLLEAMARGVGAIVSDLPALSELAGLGEGVDVVPVSDPEGLAATMIRWMEDPTVAARCGQEARHTVEQHFRLDQMVAHYEALYAEILDG